MIEHYQAPKTSGNKRHFRRFIFRAQPLLVIAMMFGLSACTTTSKTSSLISEDIIVTGSVSKPIKPEGIEGTDAEVIKTVVADSTPAITSELAWSNPDTGNSGTILAIDKFTGSSGQKCKKFKTTVDSFMGISLYDGETCEVKRGLWVLSWFMRR